jgi:hypothetical protein
MEEDNFSLVSVESSAVGLEIQDNIKFGAPPASPSQPFRSTVGRTEWSSPTVKSALHNGIQDQTTLQQAMLRERIFAMEKGSNSIPQPAGQRSGVRPGPTTAGDTIWGTISHPQKEAANAHVGRGDVLSHSCLPCLHVRF